MKQRSKAAIVSCKGSDQLMCRSEVGMDGKPAEGHLPRSYILIRTDTGLLGADKVHSQNVMKRSDSTKRFDKLSYSVMRYRV